MSREVNFRVLAISEIAYLRLLTKTRPLEILGTTTHLDYSVDNKEAHCFVQIFFKNSSKYASVG